MSVCVRVCVNSVSMHEILAFEKFAAANVTNGPSINVLSVVKSLNQLIVSTN